MDPTSLVVLIATFTGSQVARKVADDVVDHAWDRLKELSKERIGHEPKPADFHASVVSETGLDHDSEVLDVVRTVVGASSAVRRAQVAEEAVQGANILWVDDNPDWIESEREMLNALGTSIQVTTRSESARDFLQNQNFDLVLSDISRHGKPDEGVLFLERMRSEGHDEPVVFYVGHVDQDRGTPPGSFGITRRPDELLHLVLDVLERKGF